MENSNRKTNWKHPGSIGALAGLLVILAIVLLVNPPSACAQSEIEQEPVIEGFSLFRYEDDLSWRLSGKEAGRKDSYLWVKEFEFVVSQSGSGDAESLYSLSGKKIGLRSNGGQKVAIIPGKLEIDIPQGLSGTAGNARYDFSTGGVTGGDIDLVQMDGENKTSLKGRNFQYSYNDKTLIITGGFRAAIVNSERELLEISGGRLTWKKDGNITMTGELTASTDSGWRLSASRMSWRVGGENLVCLGSVVAVKDRVRIEGDSLTYDGTSKEVMIKNAKMTRKDD